MKKQLNNISCQEQFNSSTNSKNLEIDFLKSFYYIILACKHFQESSFRPESLIKNRHCLDIAIWPLYNFSNCTPISNKKTNQSDR